MANKKTIKRDDLMSGHEKRLVDLANGKVEPKNESEKKMLKEIKEIRASGMLLEIPSDL